MNSSEPYLIDFQGKLAFEETVCSGVKLVMEAICVLKDIPPEKVADPDGGTAKVNSYWGPSKKLLGDMNFLNTLKTFDKDNINQGLLQPDTNINMNRNIFQTGISNPI